MSKASTIIVDRPATYVLRIRVNRPEKLNAIDFDVREDIYNALIAHSKDPDVRVLVFGGMDGNLSAGGDLPSMENLSLAEATARLDHIHRLCRLVMHLDIPIVTCVTGVAAGAAVGLALLGDYIIGEADSRVLVPFLKLGLVPDWGMTLTLPARIGLPKARHIMLESKVTDAQTAFDIGLYDELVEKDQGEARAVEKAIRLARLPRGAVGKLKQSLRVAGLDTHLDTELRDQVECLTGPEFAEGFSSFMDKRRADFTKMPK